MKNWLARIYSRILCMIVGFLIYKDVKPAFENFMMKEKEEIDPVAPHSGQRQD